MGTGEETNPYGAIAVTTGAYIMEMSRKWNRRTDISASIIPHPDINAVFPVINWLMENGAQLWLLSVDL